MSDLVPAALNKLTVAGWRLNAAAQDLAHTAYLEEAWELQQLIQKLRSLTRELAVKHAGERRHLKVIEKEDPHARSRPD
jgi:hypothetical protein